MSRLEQLIQFHQDDPSDPFLIYGLALEYLKIDVAKSEELFDRLLADFPDYLPTYYHAARLKASIGNINSALEIYRKGIDLAIRLKEKATQRELQSAYEELSFE